MQPWLRLAWLLALGKEAVASERGAPEASEHAPSTAVSGHASEVGASEHGAPEASEHAASTAVSGHASGAAEEHPTTCESASGEYSVGGAGSNRVVFKVSGTDFQATYVTGPKVGQAPIFGKIFSNCLGGVSTLGGAEFSDIFQVTEGSIVWNDGHKVWTKSLGSHASKGDEGGHGETGGHQKVLSPVPVTVATMLFTMLLMGIGLLYMVNSPDKDIKASSYDMISNTMSVFVAVLINQGLNAVLVEQLLYGHYPGLGIQKHPLVNAAVAVLLLFGFWVAVSYFGWSARKLKDFSALDVPGDDNMSKEEKTGFRRRSRLYALAHLGGHCIAFAAVTAAGEILACAHNSHGSMRTAVALFFGMSCLLFVAWRVSTCMRAKLIKPARGDLEDEEYHHHYVARVEHGEMEGMMMTMSFIMIQIVGIDLLDAPMSLHHAQENLTMRKVQQMCFAALGFLILSIVIQIQIARSKSRRLSLRMVVSCLALAASWGLQWGSLWAAQLLLHPFPCVSPELTAVINAFNVSVISVMVMYIIDCIADSIEARSLKEPAEHGQGPARSSPLPDKIQPLMNVMAVMDKVSLKDVRLNVGGLQVADLHVDDAELGRSLRSFIVACSVLVALSWDKAFHAAILTLVDGVGEIMVQNRLTDHKVIFTATTTFAMVALVFPAWYWFIVPKVLAADEAHGAHLHSNDDLGGCLEGGGHDHDHGHGSDGSDVSEEESHSDEEHSDYKHAGRHH